MKTTTINRTGVIDKRYEQKDTRPLRFNAAALQHVREVLTGMYGNAPVAVFRETLTNALDAQIAAGNTTNPVKVTLPTEENNWVLTVQDFGVGMRRATIDENYSDYGGSSKRDSNDEHGGFGMGAKAALAVASSFTVETNQDGLKTVFHMGTIDSDDESGVFSLTFDSETPTTDPNGTTVTIPYPERTTISSRWMSNEFKSLMRGMKPGMVEVDGKIWVDTIYNTDKFHSVMGLDGEADVWYPTNPEAMGYDYQSDSASFNIVLGSVPYTVTYSKLVNNLPGDRDDYKEALQAFTSLTRMGLTGMHVYVSVPISVIKPIPNREDIAYTPQTVETILNIAVETKKRIISDLIEKIHTFDTPKQVVGFVNQWEVYLNGVEISWRGETMPKSFGEPENFEFPILRIRKPNLRGEIFQVTNERPYNMNPYKDHEGKRIVVTYGKDATIDNAYNVADKIKKRWNTFTKMSGSAPEVLIVPARVMENHWWSWKPEFNTKWGTADEIYAGILSYSRHERSSRTTVGVVRPDFPYKLVTFVPSVDENTPAYLVAKDISDDDSRLSKNILYMNENEGYVYAYQAKTAVTRQVEFWDLYGEKFADTHTILLMNTRQRLDTLLRKFPDAKKLRDVVKKEILSTTPKSVTLSKNDIRAHLGYSERSLMDILAKTYTALIKGELIKPNLALEKAIDVWVNTPDVPEVSTAETLFRENAYQEYRALITKQSAPIAAKILKTVNKYRFFGNVAGLSTAMEDKNLPGLVALYRKVK